jgi:allantoate deiminase
MIKLDAMELGRRAEAMHKELARISAEPDRLVRFFLTPEHRRAADLVARWMGEAELTVSEDAVGNVRGRIGEGPRLLLGSHLDSVIDAGIYDGPLGVIAPILAVDAFKRAGVVPPSGIEVIAVGDEEASRFPSTLSTSAALAGAFEESTLSLKDGDGVTYAQALRAYGKDPAKIASAAIPPGDVAAYLEVHIEQGPVLEAKNQPLGVVTAIVGQTRLAITLTGTAGHAGTVPMKLRRDALAGAAEIALMVERMASTTDGMVATVGSLAISPGAVNIIPGKVHFTLDLRTASDERRQSGVREFDRQARAIAARRGLVIDIATTHGIPTVPCDPRLQNDLAAAIQAVGGKDVRLASGAGHDGMMFAKICPIVMLFVRCKGGVSHNPAEYASPHDISLAVAALVRFIESFDSGRYSHLSR